VWSKAVHRSELEMNKDAPHLQISVNEFLEFELCYELTAHFQCDFQELKPLCRDDRVRFNAGIKHVIDKVVSPQCRRHTEWKMQMKREQQKLQGANSPQENPKV